MYQEMSNVGFLTYDTSQSRFAPIYRPLGLSFFFFQFFEVEETATLMMWI